MAIVQVLLDRGAKVNEKTDSGWTVLHGAARCGHVEVVRLLLENGVDVAAKEIDGGTALHSAAACGHEMVVVELAEVCEVVIELYYIYIYANMLSTYPRDWPGVVYPIVVKLLMEKEANVGASNRFGWTALHGAAAFGYKAVVGLLLENNAHIDVLCIILRAAVVALLSRVIPQFPPNASRQVKIQLHSITPLNFLTAENCQVCLAWQSRTRR